MRAGIPVLVALALLAGCGDGEPAAPAAGSTLRGTLVDPDGDGFLERGPAMPLAERRDLGGGRPGREIARFGQISDAHVRDEESPARVPFLDRLGTPFEPAFRPQEAETAQVLDAAVRALDAERPQAVAVTGDLADNAQANELDLAISVLDGGRADPSSGARRYEGVQQGDNPDPYYYRPDNDAPRHPGLTGAAQRPFTATGLDAPWYPALGNHDALVQGEVPSTPAIEALATGSRMLTDLDRDVRPPADEASAPAAVAALLADPSGLPGRTREITPDPRRRTLRPEQAVARLRAAVPSARTVAGRLDYTFDIGPRVRAIVLDTVRREGGSRGEVLPRQVGWLQRRLTEAGDRRVVVFSHNPLDSSDGGGRRARGPGRRRPRRRGDLRPPPPQRDRGRPARLLAHQHGVAGRLPAAVADVLPARGRGRGRRARHLDGRPRRARRGRAGARAGLPRRPGRPPAGLRRAPRRPQRALVHPLSGYGPPMPSRILGAFFLVAGALHFIKPRPYESMMPEALPAHRELVYLSGLAEMAGGAGVLVGPHAARGGLVADRDDAGRLPGQRHHGRRSRALPEHPGAAAVGPTAPPGSDRLLDLARHFGRQTAMMSRIEMMPASSPPSTTTR